MNSKNKIYKLLSSAFGLGFLPIAPGTWGTLLGVAIHIGVFLAAARGSFLQIMLIALAIVCIISVPLGNWAEKYWQRKDPKPFVLDEVAGYLLTASFFFTGNIITTIIWAFIMSRIFDILKPWPVRLAENLPGGWGILIDDLLASVYAVILLLLVNHFAPGLLALTWAPIPTWMAPGFN